jgi:hypothetical protein
MNQGYIYVVLQTEQMSAKQELKSGVQHQHLGHGGRAD